MRETLFLVSNYVSFLLTCLLLTALQSALWLQMFGYTPPPYLWLAVANYWIMFRSPAKAVIMSYLIAYVLFSMSGMPLSHIFFLVLINFFILYFLRDRVLWAGPSQFMLACGASAVMIPISSLLSTFVMDPTPVFELEILELLLSPLFTALFSLPLYSIFTFIDRLTQQEAPKDATSELI